MNEENKERGTEKEISRRMTLLGLGTAALLPLCLVCVPLLRWMLQPEFGLWLRRQVAELGVWGAFALLGVQVLQVVVAILPGEPVELAAGAMYGTWGGLLLCLCGCVLGSAGVFLAVRRLGRPAFDSSALGSRLGRYRFLQDQARLEGLVFLLYLIPGTPKDILVYACALSPLPLGRFLLLSTLARVPSVLTSTWAGDSFTQNRLWLTLAICAFAALLGFGGLLLHHRLVDGIDGGGE